MEIRAEYDLYEWHLGQITRGGGMFGVFYDLHRSLRWVCKMASLKQTSENVCSSDVSASSVLVYYVCG